MNEENLEKLENYFNSIKNIEEFQVNFDFKSRIVFENDEDYIFFLFNNLDKIKFKKRFKKNPTINICKNCKLLKMIEEEIKKWCKNVIQSNQKDFFNDGNKKKIKSLNLKLTLKNYLWKINTMELGNLGKLLILINQIFDSSINYNLLFRLFKIKDFDFDILIEYYWVFGVMRNTTYHYRNKDQLLLLSSLKLLENYIILNKQEKEKNLFFTFKTNEKGWKFSLIYQKIDFFEKSFKKIQYLKENVLKYI